MAALMMIGSACTKYYTVEKTQIIRETGPEVKIIDINVPKTSWAYSKQEDNNYFYATINMPEIDYNTFRDGVVQVYRIYDENTANATQVILPCVRHREEPVGDDWYFFTETIDYEFKLGKLIICYTASDFDYEVNTSFTPDAMKFRCAIYKTTPDLPVL